MRPFLGGLWATLRATNDGLKRPGNLAHTKRIAHSLNWILALLGEKKAPFVWVFRAIRTNSGAIVVTDASTWGLGGVLFIHGEPKEFFSCPIPFEFIRRTKATPGLPKFMALRESLCLLLAARLWLTRFPVGSVVRVKADNVGALFLLAKGKATSSELSIVAREIALDQAMEKYEVTILEHINTKVNVVADALSRQHDPFPSEFPTERLRGARRALRGSKFLGSPRVKTRVRCFERGGSGWVASSAVSPVARRAPRSVSVFIRP